MQHPELTMETSQPNGEIVSTEDVQEGEKVQHAAHSDFGPAPTMGDAALQVAQPRPDTAKSPTQMTINALVDEINESWGNAVVAEGHMRSAEVARRIEIGKKLNKLKEIIGHGDWEFFAAERFPLLKKRTRVKLMSLAAADINQTYYFLGQELLDRVTRLQKQAKSKGLDDETEITTNDFLRNTIGGGPFETSEALAGARETLQETLTEEEGRLQESSKSQGKGKQSSAQPKNVSKVQQVAEISEAQAYEGAEDQDVEEDLGDAADDYAASGAFSEEEEQDGDGIAESIIRLHSILTSGEQYNSINIDAETLRETIELLQKLQQKLGSV